MSNVFKSIKFDTGLSATIGGDITFLSNITPDVDATFDLGSLNKNWNHIYGTTGIFTDIIGTLKTIAQPNITSVGTLSSLTISGDLLVDDNTLKVDSVSNIIGIGLSNPLNKVHIKGDNTITGTTASSVLKISGISQQYGAVALGDGESSNANVGIARNGNNSLIVGGYDGIVFSAAGLTSGTDHMRILSNGNIGISQGLPQYKLDVNGGINASSGISGILQTSAQPNITSVGTLSSLTVSGTLTANGNTILGDASTDTVTINGLIQSGITVNPGTTSFISFGGGRISYNDSSSNMTFKTGNIDAIVIDQLQGLRPNTNGSQDLGANGFFWNNIRGTNLILNDTLTVSGNTILGNESTDTLTLTAEISSNIVPNTTARELGSASKRWNNIYGSTLDVSGPAIFTSGITFYGDGNKFNFVSPFWNNENETHTHFRYEISGNVPQLFFLAGATGTHQNNILVEYLTNAVNFGTTMLKMNFSTSRIAVNKTVASETVDVNGNVKGNYLIGISGITLTTGITAGFVLTDVVGNGIGVWAPPAGLGGTVFGTTGNFGIVIGSSGIFDRIGITEVKINTPSSPGYVLTDVNGDGIGVWAPTTGTFDDIFIGGNLGVSGNSVLGNDSNDTLTIYAGISSNINPTIDNTFSLGNGSKRWNDIYSVFGYFTTLRGTLHSDSASQPNITSVGTLSSLTVSGNLLVDTDTFKVDSVSNIIGIGTINPLNKVHIKGDNTITGTTASSVLKISDSSQVFGAIALGDNGTSNSNVGIARNGDNSLIVGAYGTIPAGTTQGIVFTISNNPLGSQTERMRIMENGNVGIGTTTSVNLKFAENKLVVYDAVNPVIKVGDAVYNGTIALGDTNQSGNFVGLLRSGSTPNNVKLTIGSYGTASTNKIAFSTGEFQLGHGSNTEHMVITGQGNVGIGSVNPTNKLDVAGNIALTGQLLGVSGYFSNNLTVNGSVGIGIDNPSSGLLIESASDGQNILQLKHPGGSAGIQVQMHSGGSTHDVRWNDQNGNEYFRTYGSPLLSTFYSDLKLESGFSLKVRTTTSTSITLDSTDYMIKCGSTFATTVQLPFANGNNGRKYMIVKSNTGGAITIQTQSGDFIDDGTTTSIQLLSQYQSTKLISDGENIWYIE